MIGLRRRSGPLRSAATATRVGRVALGHPVLTAAGTSGHGAELAPYVPLAELGAVVVKSLRADPWPGNPAPRVHETPGGMLNSVGLQGRGVAAWLAEDLPPLVELGATVVASIWGTTVGDYVEAATGLIDAADAVVAVEVNLSCPNHHARGEMFAHDPARTAEVMAAVAEVCDRPLWAKLSPNVGDLVPVAAAAQDAGADAVTLVNTVMGMVIDPDRRRPVLGSGERGGGLSGPAIHPVAVRAVWDVHAALGDLPIVGVGGVASPEAAMELIQAGASAVQVGTASFADPRAAGRIAAGVTRWCARHQTSVAAQVGVAHDHEEPS